MIVLQVLALTNLGLALWVGVKAFRTIRTGKSRALQDVAAATLVLMVALVILHFLTALNVEWDQAKPLVWVFVDMYTLYILSRLLDVVPPKESEEPLKDYL